MAERQSSAWAGKVQVYTGEGKGKTTAALGLALRAAGAGLPVFIAQFMKSGESSELAALARLGDTIRLEQFGTGRFVRGAPGPEDVAAAARGLARVREVMQAGGWRVVILDEANLAASLGLLPIEELLALIDTRPADMELVFTGRAAPPALLARADLVSEIRAVKHYFQRGVAARLGIEA
jgi:cob(I)alamin adenosyltransferase